MDGQRHLRLPREREEQPAGREPPGSDHRAFPRRPGVQLSIKGSSTSAEAYSCRFLLLIRLTFTTCPRALSSGLSRAFRRATTVANYVLLAADMPIRITLRLRRTSV